MHRAATVTPGELHILLCTKLVLCWNGYVAGIICRYSSNMKKLPSSYHKIDKCNFFSFSFPFCITCVVSYSQQLSNRVLLDRLLPKSRERKMVCNLYSTQGGRES